MLNRRHILLGGTAIAVAATVSSGSVAAAAPTLPGEDAIAWLKANAIPLAAAEPGSDMKDLEPFRAMIGDARLVGLGEATHGTREFFQLKHRLIQYCISELGFSMIGFEAEYGTTLAVNDYVLFGKGNALDATTGMGFWTWDTEEVVALVEWVRAWNLSHDSKVKFYGFDMQGSAAPLMHLLGYLERVAPRIAASTERDLAPLGSYLTNNDLLHFSEDDQRAVRDRIDTVIEAFDERRDDWIADTSGTEWHLARQSARVVKQFSHALHANEGDDWTKSFNFRDRAMAANIRALLDGEGRNAKAVLWAHNGHVQQSSYLGVANMGSSLEQEFGDDYVVVGFAFNQGAFQALGRNTEGLTRLMDHKVGPAPAGSIDATMAATGMPLFALDLSRVPDDGPVARWMASKPAQRTIGALFVGAEDQYVSIGDPRDNYDVLLFVDTTTAAHGNKRSSYRMAGAGKNDEPTNLALEMQDGMLPQGWRSMQYSLYAFTLAADVVSPKGGRTMRIARSGSPLPWGDAELAQSFPAAPWHGRRLTFSAAMRAEAQRIGTGAVMVVRVFPKRKEGDKSDHAMLVTRSEGMMRSADWTRRSVTVDVPAEAERIEISLMVTGNSAGIFGDLELAAGGATVGMLPMTPTRRLGAGGGVLSPSAMLAGAFGG
jgi:erythromycin esterase